MISAACHAGAKALCNSISLLHRFSKMTFRLGMHSPLLPLSLELTHQTITD